MFLELHLKPKFANSKIISYCLLIRISIKYMKNPKYNQSQRKIQFKKKQPYSKYHIGMSRFDNLANNHFIKLSRTLLPSYFGPKLGSRVHLCRTVSFSCIGEHVSLQNLPYHVSAAITSSNVEKEDAVAMNDNNNYIDMCVQNFMVYGKKIVAAGLNYRSVLLEKGLSAPSKPALFLKPTSSYIREGQNIEVPEGFGTVQEVELGVVIGKKCKRVSEAETMDYVGGYCLALDMTSGTLLEEARNQGMPWTIAKGFDTACPVSEFIPKERIRDPNNVNIWCKVNENLWQNANTSDLVFGVQQLISYTSQYMTLEPGDVLLTGSPPGTGPVSPGDVIEAGLRDIVTMRFKITAI